MSKVEKDCIGENLRRERTARGITIKQLSEMIEANGGGYVSESQISLWENGKRRIYADQLKYICKSLRMSPIPLLGCDTENNDLKIKRLQDEVVLLPEDELEIFYHLFYKWNGNPRAMVKFIGLYMSLPRELRLDIAGMGITMYKIGAKSDQLDHSAPKVDFDYIDTAWEKLLK